MLAPLLSLLIVFDVVAGAKLGLHSKRFLDTSTHEERSRVPNGWVQRTGGELASRSDVPALDKKSFSMYVRKLLSLISCSNQPSYASLPHYRVDRGEHRNGE